MDGSYLKKLTPHRRGVEVGILGGSKNQKSGKCHEMSRKSIKQIDPAHPGPWVVGQKLKRAGKIKSPGNVMNCPENQLKKLSQPTLGPGGWGSKIKKGGKFHELPGKSITKNSTPGGQF